jgi:hypothetical protein
MSRGSTHHTQVNVAHWLYSFARDAWRGLALSPYGQKVKYEVGTVMHEVADYFLPTNAQA